MTNIAAPGKRFIAYVIDTLVFLDLELLVIRQASATSDLTTIMDNILNLIILVLFGGLAYRWANIFLTSRFGGSLGKLITGLKVVNPENGNISFWRAVFRNYVGYFVSGTLAWLGFFWIFKDKERRGWHDMIANTFVVEKNKAGVFGGVVTAIGLLVLSGYLTVTTVRNINSHLPTYKEVFEDIKTEFKPTPTPIPPPFVPPPGL